MTSTATTTLDPITLAAGHPAWCDPTRCTVLPDLPDDEGVHLSTAVHLEAPLTVRGPLGLRAWLQQTARGDQTTYLALDTPDLAGSRVLYPVLEAGPSLTALQQLLDRAGRD